MSFIIEQEKEVVVGEKMKVGNLEYSVSENFMDIPTSVKISNANARSWNSLNVPKHPEISMIPEIKCWYMKLDR